MRLNNPLQKNNPSKKIIALGIVSAGFVCAILISKYVGEFSFSFFKKAPPDTQSAIAYAPTATDDNAQDKIDTDKDGLRDWEELLWGTDPKNPDSDGDGTPDGEEVKNGRDPLKKGPDDFLSQYNGNADVSIGSGASDATNTPPKNLNASDVFSQQLFSKYMTLKNAGTDADPESTGPVVSDLTDQALTAFSFRQYNKSGLRVFDATSKPDLRLYASSIAILELDFLNKIKDASAQVNDDSDLEKLAKVYADFAQALYEIKAPGQLSTEHLTIVNNMSILSSVYSALAKYKEDPVPAISAIKAYKTTDASQAEVLPQIADYLRKNDIIFTEGVEANFWNSF